MAHPIEQRKVEPPLQHYPVEIVDSILSGELPAESNVVYRDDTAEIRRIYNAIDQISGVGVIDLSIDQRHYFQQWPNDFDMVDFQYNRGTLKPIATMQFLYMPDGSYQLAHRFVQPEFRRKGVGERLLAQAEHAFQEGATKEQRDIEIRLQGGQRGVLEWFRKRGYEAADERSAELLKEILDHPKRFVIETIVDARDQQEKEDCIFELETTGRTLEDTVRINLKKVLKPQAESAS